jgi:SH3 domain protein
LPVFASTALLISTLVICTLAVAETLYIRDDLYVPLRGGQTNEHRILPMEHLEENPETGYTHVRLENGMEGWLQTQYLVDQPIARDLLDKATLRLAKIEQDDQENKTRLKALEAERATLFTQDQNLNDENQALQSELQRINDLAANVLNIEDKNQLLQTEQIELKGQIEALLLESEELRDDSSRAWFLRGAGTILIGLLFGFIVARRIYSRQAASGWV